MLDELIHEQELVLRISKENHRETGGKVKVILQLVHKPESLYKETMNSLRTQLDSAEQHLSSMTNVLERFECQEKNEESKNDSTQLEAKNRINFASFVVRVKEAKWESRNLQILDQTQIKSNHEEKSTDPLKLNAYCRVSLQNQYRKSPIIQSTNTPRWDFETTFQNVDVESSLYIASHSFDSSKSSISSMACINVEIFDASETGDSCIGIKSIPIDLLINEEAQSDIEGWNRESFGDDVNPCIRCAGWLSLSFPLEEVGMNFVVSGKGDPSVDRVMVFVEIDMIPILINQKITSNLNIRLGGIGVSLIDHRPAELIYMSIENVSFDFIEKSDERSLSFSINDIQISNQDWSQRSHLPIILGRTRASTSNRQAIHRPIVDFSLLQSLSKETSGGALILPYASLSLQVINFYFYFKKI